MLARILSVSFFCLSVVFTGFRQIGEENGVEFPSFSLNDLGIVQPKGSHEKPWYWFSYQQQQQRGIRSWISNPSMEAFGFYRYENFDEKDTTSSWFDKVHLVPDFTSWWKEVKPGDVEDKDTESPALNKEQPIPVEPDPNPQHVDSVSDSMEAGSSEATTAPVEDVMEEQTGQSSIRTELRNIGEKTTELLQRIKLYAEYVASSNSVFVALITLPYTVVFIVQFSLKKGSKLWSVQQPLMTNEKKTQLEADDSETVLDEKVPLFDSDSSKDVTTVKEKGSDLEMMAKTVEYLERKCGEQEGQLQKKGSELEEMARTVEYLQRPGVKRWRGLVNRVPIYHSTYPAIPNMRYYQFHVPMGTDERIAVPGVVRLGNSEEDLSAREESDLSDGESGSDLEWDD